MPRRRRDDATAAAHREGVAARLAHQWAAMRRQERAARAGRDRGAGTSNFSRAEVPYGVDLAAAWSWRLLVIAAAPALLGYLISFFAVMVIPVVVALLISALVVPVVDWLERVGVRRSVASILVVVLTIARGRRAAHLRRPAGGQRRRATCADSTVDGLAGDQGLAARRPAARQRLADQRLHQAAPGRDQRADRRRGVLSRVTEVGTAVGHILAGFFIVLFSTYFFLADGNRIWAWLVRLSPRAARERVDSSGRVAWISLTQFVRATVHRGRRPTRS